MVTKQVSTKCLIDHPIDPEAGIVQIKSLEGNQDRLVVKAASPLELLVFSEESEISLNQVLIVEVPSGLEFEFQKHTARIGRVNIHFGNALLFDVDRDSADGGKVCVWGLPLRVEARNGETELGIHSLPLGRFAFTSLFVDLTLLSLPRGGDLDEISIDFGTEGTVACDRSGKFLPIARIGTRQRICPSAVLLSFEDGDLNKRIVVRSDSNTLRGPLQAISTRAESLKIFAGRDNERRPMKDLQGRSMGYVQNGLLMKAFAIQLLYTLHRNQAKFAAPHPNSEAPLNPLRVYVTSFNGARGDEVDSWRRPLEQQLAAYRPKIEVRPTIFEGIAPIIAMLIFLVRQLGSSALQFLAGSVDLVKEIRVLGLDRGARTYDIARWLISVEAMTDGRHALTLKLERLFRSEHGGRRDTFTIAYHMARFLSATIVNEAIFNSGRKYSIDQRIALIRGLTIAILNRIGERLLEPAKKIKTSKHKQEMVMLCGGINSLTRLVNDARTAAEKFFEAPQLFGEEFLPRYNLEPPVLSSKNPLCLGQEPIDRAFGLHLIANLQDRISLIVSEVAECAAEGLDIDCVLTSGQASRLHGVVVQLARRFGAKILPLRLLEETGKYEAPYDKLVIADVALILDQLRQLDWAATEVFTLELDILGFELGFENLDDPNAPTFIDADTKLSKETPKAPQGKSIKVDQERVIRAGGLIDYSGGKAHFTSRPYFVVRQIKGEAPIKLESGALWMGLERGPRLTERAQSQFEIVPPRDEAPAAFELTDLLRDGELFDSRLPKAVEAKVDVTKLILTEVDLP